MKRYYMPSKAQEKLIWLQNLSNKIENYAAKYGITAAAVTDMKDGYVWLAYWMNYRQQYQEYLKKLSKFKDEIMNDLGATSVPPSPPTFAAAPTSVSSGIIVRAMAIVNAIKSNIGYTIADGNDLGIEGVEMVGRIDFKDAQPQIKVRLVSGGHPEIVWTKGDFDGIDIYVNRGNGHWEFLATDSYPNYTDTTPLPAVGLSAAWSYKTIYRYDDEQVGQWSNPVSISVIGA